MADMEIPRPACFTASPRPKELPMTKLTAPGLSMARSSSLAMPGESRALPSMHRGYTVPESLGRMAADSFSRAAAIRSEERRVGKEC